MPLRERMRFVQTYKTITTREPYKSRYNELVFDHPKLSSHIHTLEQFLPWHRHMLRNFEKLMQEVWTLITSSAICWSQFTLLHCELHLELIPFLQVDPAITLPYWDWSLNHLSPWRTSILDIWSAQPWGLGGNGDDVTRCVTNGPFSVKQWSIVTAGGGHTCLKRRFNGMLLLYSVWYHMMNQKLFSTSSSFIGITPGIMTIHRALRFEPANFTQFEDYVRNFLHDVIHWRIGGTMGDEYGSRAPEFMLHHGFLDKIWSDYQQQSDEHKWTFFKNSNYNIFKTNISVLDVVDNTDILGDSVCYNDPFEDYKDIHRTLRKYNLNTIRGLMSREAFTAPYFEHYIEY